MVEKKKYIPALGFGWLTGVYDLTIKFTMPEKKFRNRLVDFLGPKPNEQILEFGFGTGQNLILAKARSSSSIYTGLDIDPKVKRIAERKIKENDIEIKLDLYNGHSFPYKDKLFDKVFSSLVFHQLDKDSKISALDELYRVLKPNGLLLIGDWGKSKSRLMRIRFYLVQILDGFSTTNDNVKGLLPDYMMRAGFENVQELAYINTSLGSYCYYVGYKPC